MHNCPIFWTNLLQPHFNVNCHLMKSWPLETALSVEGMRKQELGQGWDTETREVAISIFSVKKRKRELQGWEARVGIKYEQWRFNLCHCQHIYHESLQDIWL